MRGIWEPLLVYMYMCSHLSGHPVKEGPVQRLMTIFYGRQDQPQNSHEMWDCEYLVWNSEQMNPSDRKGHVSMEDLLRNQGQNLDWESGRRRRDLARHFGCQCTNHSMDCSKDEWVMPARSRTMWATFYGHPTLLLKHKLVRYSEPH